MTAGTQKEDEDSMDQSWNRAELAAAMEAMRGFENRCSHLATLVNDRADRRDLENLYKQLKSDLNQAAKTGTLLGKRTPQTRIESAFYYPAVRNAHIALRPATNSNPQNSGWAGALWKAGTEFTYFLSQMEELSKKP
jgi:ribonuclease HI